MLETAYYNNKLSLLRAQSEFYGVTDALIDSINDFDSCLIACALEIVNETGSPISMEALGDYVSKGAGSVTSGIGTVLKKVFNMGVWVLKTIKNMAVFAVKGFKGTVGGAIKEVDKVGDRVQHMQDRKFTNGIHVKTCARILDIVKEHMFDVQLSNLPAGKIEAAKTAYIQQFNAKMAADAKINKVFAMINPPKGMKLSTFKDAGATSADVIKRAGEHLTTAEKVLKERLDQLSERGGNIKQIIANLKAKGYKAKYFKPAESTQILVVACNAAVLANDLKYLAAMEEKYTSMVHALGKKKGQYVADNPNYVPGTP